MDRAVCFQAAGFRSRTAPSDTRFDGASASIVRAASQCPTRSSSLPSSLVQRAGTSTRESWSSS
jgi:hypothetical protein